MRVLILVALGLAFATALPQNEERSRVRGIRRFSLATPGLQAGRISDNEVVNDLGEEKPAVVEGTEPKTRSRGTSILRRGHPSRRLIGRPAADNQDPSAAVVVEAVQDAPAKGTGRVRDGLRIRRPIKKITTASVATTTSQPMTEEPAAADSATQTLVSTTSASTTVPSESGTMMQKTEESMLTEESKPMGRDEAVQDSNMKDAMPNQEQGGEIVEEDLASSKSELKSQGPRPKKLRPIPIKLGRRGQGEADQSATIIDSVPEEPEQLTSGNQASSHRFSSRPRPALRRRPMNKEANQQQTEAAAQPAAVEAPAEEGSKKTRTRSRVPALSRQPARSSPRRRISQQPETVAEDIPVSVSVAEDSVLPIQEPEIRVLDINELKTLLSTISADEVIASTPSTQNARIRPRIRKPSQTQEVTDIRSEIDSTPSVEAPVSESVRNSRPQQSIGNRGSPVEDYERASSKYPTPNYGGSDLIFKAGEVQVSQIGTIEDTPREEVRRILAGLGSKRRGLGRPKVSTRPDPTPAIRTTPTDTVAASSNQELQSDIDLLYDYYQ